MKLLRYGPPGAEKPALLAKDGTIRCLSSVVRDIDGFALVRSGAEDDRRHRSGDACRRWMRIVRLGSCVARPVNYVCIGLNYADHAAEAGMPVPKEPIIFLKSLGALCGPNDDVKLPRGSKKLDWEVELGIVIGKTARYVPENEAMDYVAGYCVCNDVSEREFQIERAGTWDKGKGCDTFGPTGPWVVTKDEIPDPQALPLWTEVNGKRMQNGTTKTMIFGVVKLVSYVSHFITLHAGRRDRDRHAAWCRSGREAEPGVPEGRATRCGCRVEGLGVQTQRVVEADRRRHGRNTHPGRARSRVRLPDGARRHHRPAATPCRGTRRLCRSARPDRIAARPLRPRGGTVQRVPSAWETSDGHAGPLHRRDGPPAAVRRRHRRDARARRAGPRCRARRRAARLRAGHRGSRSGRCTPRGR